MDDGTEHTVEDILAKTQGVRGHSQIRSRKMGPFTIIDLGISVDPTMVCLTGFYSYIL
jgi:divalent metal cation (Fe/Co/Zn/Cd) transporter